MQINKEKKTVKVLVLDFVGVFFIIPFFTGGFTLVGLFSFATMSQVALSLCMKKNLFLWSRVFLCFLIFHTPILL